MEINVTCENNLNYDFIFSEEKVECFSKKMLTFALNNITLSDFSQSYDYNFDVNICDNNFIQEINKNYRNIDQATDVITFSLYFDSEEKIIIDNTINLGQILISADKVSTQSKENNVTEEYEFLNLLAHGILHLLGIDHQTEELLIEMLSIQDNMIKDIQHV